MKRPSGDKVAYHWVGEPGDAAVEAASSWAADVRARRVPTPEQSYHVSPEVAELLRDRQSEA